MQAIHCRRGIIKCDCCVLWRHVTWSTILSLSLRWMDNINTVSSCYYWFNCWFESFFLIWHLFWCMIWFLAPICKWADHVTSMGASRDHVIELMRQKVQYWHAAMTSTIITRTCRDMLSQCFLSLHAVLFVLLLITTVGIVFSLEHMCYILFKQINFQSIFRKFNY